MTTSSAETKLCLLIIGSHFGPVSEAVATEIFRFQKISFVRISELMRAKPKYSNKKDFSRVRDAMLVLTQHGCVHAEPPPLDEDAAEDSRRPVDRVLYSMNVAAILNRLRIPKTIAISTELYGEVGMMIVEEFVLHGRLGMSQLLLDVTARLGGAEGAGEAGGAEAQIRETFERMAADRFLQPVAALSSFARSGAAESEVGKSKLDSLVADAKPAAAKKAAAAAVAKKGKGAATATSAGAGMGAGEKRKRGAAAVEELPLELRMMMQASAAAEEEEAAGDGLSSKYAKLAQESTVSSAKAAPKAVGRGRRGKQSAAEAEAAPEELLAPAPAPARPGNSDSTALWTFGWVQYTRYERNMTCMKVVAERMGKLAESIIRAMLSRSIAAETSAPEVTTHSLPCRVSDVAAALGARAPAAAQIRSILELLRQDKMAAVSLMRGEDNTAADASYVVNIQGILEFLRRKTAHSVACEKFGEVSGRIFELLLDKKYLDQQRIGDLAIAPSRDVRKRMYDLYKANFIDYIDVSRRGDFNTLSTIFLWHVNSEKFKAATLDLIYKSIYNMLIRRKVECEQKKDVLELAQRSPGMNLDPSLAQRFDSFMISIDRLDNSILYLTESYVVMYVL